MHPTTTRRRTALAGAAACLALTAPAAPAGTSPEAAPSLEVVFGLMRSAGDADTVSATVVDWIDRQIAEEAARSGRQIGSGVPTDPGAVPGVLPLRGSRCEGDPAARTTASRTRLLIDRPGRIRSDARYDDGRRHVAATVGTRRSVLVGSDVFTARVTAARVFPAGAATAANMLRPAALIDAADYRVLGLERLPTGPAVVLRARARQADVGEAPVLGGLGEDEYRVWVDLRRGVVVRLEAREEGRPFLRTSIDELALGRAIPASAFVLRPLAGGRSLTPADLVPRPTPLPRAMRRVGVTLHGVSGLPSAGVAVVPGVPGISVRLTWPGAGWSLEQHRATALDRCTVERAGTTITMDGVRVGLLSQRPLRMRAILGRTAVTAEGGSDMFRLAQIVVSLRPLG